MVDQGLELERDRRRNSNDKTCLLQRKCYDVSAIGCDSRIPQVFIRGK